MSEYIPCQNTYLMLRIPTQNRSLIRICNSVLSLETGRDRRNTPLFKLSNSFIPPLEVGTEESPASATHVAEFPAFATLCLNIAS